MLYRAKVNGDEGIFKGVKIIGDNIPLGYEKTESYFVDNSGLGDRSEPAMVASDFLSHVKEGYFYGITGRGQFQVYIGEFKKINKSRKEIYTDNGIVSSKLVKNNTRLTVYKDGRRVLRLHQTDIITWTTDGKIVINMGGYDTKTTRQRLNEFLPNLSVYRKKRKTYIQGIEFKEGMEFHA